MLLVTRVADAVADPVMGSIADRTRTRWDISVLICFGRRAVCRCGCVDLHHAASGQRSQAGVCLHHLQFPDVHLHGGEHSILGVDGRDYTEFAGAHLHLLDSLHWRFYRPASSCSTTPFRWSSSWVTARYRGWQMTMVLLWCSCHSPADRLLCYHSRARCPAPEAEHEPQARSPRAVRKQAVDRTGWRTATDTAAFAVKGSVSAYYFKYS